MPVAREMIEWKQNAMEKFSRWRKRSCPLRVLVSCFLMSQWVFASRHHAATDRKVEIKCKIKLIDFEGRSDARSIKTILAHVAPRKMVRIHSLYPERKKS